MNKDNKKVGRLERVLFNKVSLPPLLLKKISCVKVQQCLEQVKHKKVVHKLAV